MNAAIAKGTQTAGRLDHIVIAAHSLEQGAAYIQARLGVTPAMGGKHVSMGTHNLLMQLGPASYLEVIAIDPDAPAPSHARWFGLDDPVLQARLAQAPFVLTWVVGVNHIEAAIKACTYEVGTARPMTRGELNWQIALRDDGALADRGVAPILIEWPEGPHPSRNMVDLGCSLEKLELPSDQPDRLRADLASVGATTLAQVTPTPTDKRGAVGLRATISRPTGIAVLD